MQKSGYKLLFALLILGVVISACGGSDTASNVPKIETVAISDQIATPIPNITDLDLSFADIIQNPDEKNWTRTQYSTYLDTIKGRHIGGWSGTILEIEEFAGKPYLSLDMESGEPKIDAYVYINEEDVLKVSLRQKVTFEGTIDDTWPESNGFYALQIEDVTLLELGEIPTPEPSIDDLTNQKIQSLICDEDVFIQRLADTSSFIDLEQSSYPEKRVVFKDGYVETEYFAYKKLLEESARFLRDFPCLGEIQVVINHDGQKYITDVELNDFEEFLGVDFEQLQENIDEWRAFLGMIDKSLVENFAEKYVTQESSTDIADTEIESEKYVQAGDSNINLRSGPGTDYEVVGVLASGGSLEIVGRNADSSWWQVSAPEGLVWVATHVVTANNIDDTIPVIDVPPLPSQTEAHQPADSTSADSASSTPSAPEPVAPITTPEMHQEDAGCHLNARITSPASGTLFTSRVVAISGYANVPNFNHYKIEYSTDPDGGNWNYLFEKDTPVENDVLMHLETSTVPYGSYGIRLTVVDMSGNYPEPCIRWFNDTKFVTPEPATIDTESSVYPTPDTSGNAPCLCDFDRYNCSSFGGSWSAQQCFNYCVDTGHGDVHDLDRDGDGRVCEWLD